MVWNFKKQNRECEKERNTSFIVSCLSHTSQENGGSGHIYINTGLLANLAGEYIYINRPILQVVIT